MKRLNSVETDQYSLEVIECTYCGFHIGIDASYLDQAGDIEIPCPCCQEKIVTKDIIIP